jgi:hypothetical protein
MGTRGISCNQVQLNSLAAEANSLKVIGPTLKAEQGEGMLIAMYSTYIGSAARQIIPASHVLFPEACQHTFSIHL